MRHTFLIATALLSLAAAPALAQSVPPGDNPVTGARPGNIPGTDNSLPLGNTASNITPSDTSSPIAPHLPAPPVGPDGSINQYLTAARKAIAAHHSGEAQQALEMAETRALDRSVIPADANNPDQSPQVKQIQQALDNLANRDMAGAGQAIDQAMALTNHEETKM